MNKRVGDRKDRDTQKKGRNEGKKKARKKIKEGMEGRNEETRE